MMRITWTKLLAIMLITLLTLPSLSLATLAETTTPPPDIQTSVSVQKAENGESWIEYAEVSGLPDADIQETLNAYLRWFSVDVYLDDDPDRAWDTVEGKTSYTILGDRYLSVRTEYFFNGASLAHPWSDIQALVFDLSIGEPGAQLSDYLPVDTALREKILDGSFTLVYPDAEPDDLFARFAEDYVDNADPEYYNINFYLTDTGVALFLRDRIHAEGDYWVIEASFEKLEGLMTPALVELLPEPETPPETGQA
ncbi:MAG: hypothetical protein LBS11_05595 [Oscillospiraceae bacterium]|jgi:hypothetical protein|nr:hypothetical protein [Oscillospiraceae bacterium]